jgi:hypothetical protein
MHITEPVRNSLLVGTDTAGGFTLPSYLQLPMLDAMAPVSSLLTAGVGLAMLNEGAKNYRIAAINAIPTAAWRSEAGTLATSAPTFRSVDLTPQDLSFQFKVSRELMNDSSNLDGALFRAIAQAFAKELDRAGLRGSGTPPEIRGILNTTGIQAVTNGTNGASLATTAYANFISAIQALLAADAPMPNAANMSPRSLTGLAGLFDTTNQLRQQPSILDNTKFIATSQIPNNLTVGTSIASIAITVGTTVFGAVTQKAAAKKAKRAAAKARDDFLNSLQDRTVTKIATDAPHRYVYGKSKVGSDVVAVLPSGANEEYKHLICVHAAHESESIEEVYINNKPLGPLDDDGFVTSGDYFVSKTTENITETFATSPFTLTHTPSSAVKVIAYSRVSRNGVLIQNQSNEVTYTRVGNTFTVTGALPPPPYFGSIIQLIEYRITYQYQSNNSQVRVKKHLGTPDDPSDASLLAECGDKWKATSVLRGFTYTVIRLDLRQAEFQGGLPDISVLMKGKKLYDPRTGVTAWSQNPALCIYDYLTSPMCGIDPEDIPLDHMITAANACDEQIQGLC